MINCKGRFINTDDNHMTTIEIKINNETNQENQINFLELKTNRD
jgi:hypothetical protein